VLFDILGSEEIRKTLGPIVAAQGDFRIFRDL